MICTESSAGNAYPSFKWLSQHLINGVSDPAEGCTVNLKRSPNWNHEYNATYFNL